ncbi:MAG TPA: GYF domain-containing protein [Labilithrix sp.]|nr:GYF domain-containing protein [Labilithrix sp.]
MKFLCENCKAKYQIADEKVAGKTVRMKCRKCGHQIEVRAEITETSVAGEMPRPSGAPPTPPQRGSLATSLSAAKPRAATSGAPNSALAGAFRTNVHDAPASTRGEPHSASLGLNVADEWYVAINGVPVGPVRLSELRRKAASGAVTEESLCWQEGLEEWRPIRSIPELAEIVREAAQGGKAVGTPPDPPPAAPRAPSAARQPLASLAPRTSTPPPPPKPLSPARSNVVPLRPAASSNVDDHSIGSITPMGNAGTAVALAPSVTTPAEPAIAAPAPAAMTVPDPFAIPPSPPAPVIAPPEPAAAPISVATAPSRAGDKKGVPLWFWPILVLALGFGGGLAFIAFRPQPVPAPVVIQVPAPTAPPSASEKDDAPPPTASAEPAPVASSDPKAKGTTVASKGSAKPAETVEKKGIDLGNLVAGGGAPNIGPHSNGGPSAGNGLDQSGVERVVAAHRTGVKRTCWERGGADQKSSVNVTVTATVAPNGSISSTSSSGDDPVVAKCIENQVRTWQFPAPGSSTTINIPFKFVRQ